MIYILNDYDPLYEHEWVCATIEIDDNVNLEEEYLKFLQTKAEELEIIINPHWYNIMNHEDYHSNLSKTVYNKKSKEWGKILKEYNISWFIINILKGKRLKFKEINL